MNQNSSPRILHSPSCILGIAVALLLSLPVCSDAQDVIEKKMPKGMGPGETVPETDLVFIGKNKRTKPGLYFYKVKETKLQYSGIESNRTESKKVLSHRVVKGSNFSGMMDDLLPSGVGISFVVDEVVKVPGRKEEGRIKMVGYVTFLDAFSPNRNDWVDIEVPPGKNLGIWTPYFVMEYWKYDEENAKFIRILTGEQVYTGAVGTLEIQFPREKR